MIPFSGYPADPIAPPHPLSFEKRTRSADLIRYILQKNGLIPRISTARRTKIRPRPQKLRWSEDGQGREKEAAVEASSLLVALNCFCEAGSVGRMKSEFSFYFSGEV